MYIPNIDDYVEISKILDDLLKEGQSLLGKESE